ncbi:uncharacterized protein LOC129595556 [Paramacrobiotus metropolitanus]|uniref:uncharacterized protein LOC129595556 n=1 Tax=Paramacrobiotus metropolitanus TaxID=2943436 RepID=UPI002445C153|nr:uncharacterized protein LOC129595556 [Paramacrobiotus metropolitanus]
MNTTFSDRVLQDITILGDVERTRKPWSVVLADHLEGFLTGVQTLNTISSVFEKDGQNIGLTDAAVVLSNIGHVWCRQVEDTAHIAQRTIDLLDNLDYHKEKEKDPKASKPRRINVHPLTLPISDLNSDTENVLPFHPDPKIPPHRFLVKEIPKISQEKYLAPSDPCTLPLMDSEKIRSYYDDRGNKGRDWAEFKVNTLPLNREGYYPLENAPGWSQIPLAKRRYTFSVMPEVVQDLAKEDLEETLLQQPETHDMDADDAPVDHTLPEHDAGVPVVPALGPILFKQLKSSKSSSAEFRPITDLRALSRTKQLDGIPTAPVASNPQTPYKCRNKRKAIPKPLEASQVEVEFFKYFWDISTQQMNLEFIMQRDNMRLRRVEVTKREPRKKAVKTVRFESVTPMEPVAEEVEQKVAGNDGEILVNDEAGNETLTGKNNSDNAVDEVAEYVETAEPCLNVTEFNLDDLYLVPGASRGDAFNKLNFTLMARPAHTTQFLENLDASLSHESSLLEQCEFLNNDNQNWEARLEEFLEEHEPATANFNVESVGQRLMEDYQRKGKHSTRTTLSDVIRGRGSVGEVGQRFLSFLDLVNKKIVEVETKEKTKKAETEISKLSQTLEQLSIKVVHKAG